MVWYFRPTRLFWTPHIYTYIIIIIISILVIIYIYINIVLFCTYRQLFEYIYTIYMYACVWKKGNMSSASAWKWYVGIRYIYRYVAVKRDYYGCGIFYFCPSYKYIQFFAFSTCIYTNLNICVEWMIVVIIYIY